MAEKSEAKKAESKLLKLGAQWADVISPARTDVYEAGDHTVSEEVYARAVAAGAVKS